MACCFGIFVYFLCELYFMIRCRFCKFYWSAFRLASDAMTYAQLDYLRDRWKSDNITDRWCRYVCES